VLKMHRESGGVRLLYQQDGKTAITSKNSKTGETYLALFNTSETPGLELKVELADLDLLGKVKVTNLWSGEKLGVQEGAFAQSLAAHGCGLYKLSLGK